MTNEKKIIVLSELIENKLRKEQELEFYQEQLAAIQRKIANLQKDVDLTKLIIDIIETDNVIDIKEKVEKTIPIIGDKNE
tara:strand:+ start:908 stop:1147 length:240 start_codon:yes stop_codon:yes gene_type:complete